ncbi:hypothetical protein SAMN05421810_106345 [Amycolatopsis arida]|uniref:Knr4/Smi1-like domain-containing protein n=1 Tax=Amycolatopsis arida TaxID=587909 RepID=A0A1I5Y024_9PSEU|nr:SMI1/KNR4 family protein [Amycolatopsis arida]TDX97174.1 hypothetical protein CLV69_102277 [Amycolatopsis arida]SFQ37460.1 hypothetical protein SAMN05421810_106345 [Amycolatopsis arida]
MSGWAAGRYPDSVTQDVLTGGDARVDAAVGHAALLLAAAGFAAESDRVVERWVAATGRPAAGLTDAAARAWAVLLAARGTRPTWAEGLPLADAEPRGPHPSTRAGSREAGPWPSGFRDGSSPDADDVADTAPAAAPDDDVVGRLVAGLARQLGHDPPGTTRDPSEGLVDEVERRAEAGDADGAVAAIERWARRAAFHPDVARLAARPALAGLLRAGALGRALDISADWARDCADQVTAALRVRFPAPVPCSWTELVERILRLRGEPGPPPAPVPADRLATVERELGVRLPADYRAFLRTCDGLPADVVFPRLLGAAELVQVNASRTHSPAPGRLVVSDPAGEFAVITLAWGRDGWRAEEHDHVLGTTAHPCFRALLEEHLRLLEDSA